MVRRKSLGGNLDLPHGGNRESGKSGGGRAVHGGERPCPSFRGRAPSAPGPRPLRPRLKGATGHGHIGRSAPPRSFTHRFLPAFHPGGMGGLDRGEAGGMRGASFHGGRGLPGRAGKRQDESLLDSPCPITSREPQSGERKPFGNGTLASDACCPAAISMVLSYFKGERITPSEVAARYDQDAYRSREHGSYGGKMVPGGGERLRPHGGGGLRLPFRRTDPGSPGAGRRSSCPWARRGGGKIRGRVPLPWSWQVSRRMER